MDESTTLIRVSKATREKLNEIKRLTGISMVHTIDTLVDGELHRAQQTAQKRRQKLAGK